jgi:diacylglycerol kinase (ATP)
VPKRALLIINRNSRSGTTNADTVIDRLRSHAIDIIEGHPTKGIGIADLILRHRSAVDCVIVGGGDGSMNAAAPALVRTRLPLGVLPLGTANDLARTLTIPNDPVQAADVIADGVLHRIDLGRVNDRYFFNVANIGLGAQVTHHLSGDLKRRWGVVSYAHGLMCAVREFRPFRAEIAVDGRRRTVRSIQIAVGNGRHYGGGMTIAAQATIDDRQFCLYSLEPRPLWGLLKLFPVLRSGAFEERHPVDIEQGRQIEIITRRPMPVTADGELVTRTPARFSMAAGAVSVYVPTSYFEDRQEKTHAA